MRLVSTVFSIAVRGMWEKRFYEEHLSSILRRNRPASRTVLRILFVLFWSKEARTIG